MNAKIDLYKEIGGSFVIASPQPSGVGYFLLIAGDPNNPAVGLTIDGPSFTFQGNRVYSTRFTSPSSPPVPSVFKIIVSFELTNYLIQPIYSSNPSGFYNPEGYNLLSISRVRKLAV